MTIKPILKLLIVYGIATSVSAAGVTKATTKQPTTYQKYTSFQKRLFGPEVSTPGATQFGRLKLSGVIDVSASFDRYKGGGATYGNHYSLQRNTSDFLVDANLGKSWHARLTMNPNDYNAYVYYADPAKSPLFFKAGKYLLDIGDYQAITYLDHIDPKLNNQYAFGAVPKGVMTLGMISANHFYAHASTFKVGSGQKIVVNNGDSFKSRGDTTVIPTDTQGENTQTIAFYNLGYSAKAGYASHFKSVSYDVSASFTNDTSPYADLKYTSGVNYSVTKDGGAPIDDAINRLSLADGTHSVVNKNPAFHIDSTIKIQNIGFGLHLTKPGRVMKNLNVATGELSTTATNGQMNLQYTDAATLYSLYKPKDYPTSAAGVTAWADRTVALETEEILKIDGINQRVDSDNIPFYAPWIWTIDVSYPMHAYGYQHKLLGSYGTTTTKTHAVSEYPIKHQYTLGYEVDVTPSVTLFASYRLKTIMDQSINLKTNKEAYSGARTDWTTVDSGNIGATIASGQSTVSHHSGDKQHQLQVGMRVAL